jgi:Mrp family chromosome partitioning ATPase/capsular polysaccharide biosynthesis protein
MVQQHRDGERERSMSSLGDSESLTLRDYVHVVRLRWWLVAIVVAACTLTAFLVSVTQTKRYTATASLMYEKPANIANPLSSDGSTDVNSLALHIQSVVNTIGSPEVRGKASELLGGSAERDSYTVSAAILPPDSAAGATVSDVVAVNAESPSAAVSAEVANAYAGAIIATRVESEKARLLAAQDAIRIQMQNFKTKASKLSTDYLLLAQRLRDLQVAEATATGDFKIIRPAAVPDSPSSPKVLQTSALAFGASLLIGIALAFILGQFDTRVRTHRQVTKILSLPVVGRVPRLRNGVRDGRLAALDEPGGEVAEAMRMLRSNLSWTTIDGGWKSLLVTSGRQGEGKTFTICNLAVVLALAGKKVVVVDADFRAPRVHKVFSLRNDIGLSTIVRDSSGLGEALRPFNMNGMRPATLSEAQGANSVVAADASGRLLVLTSGPSPPNPGEVAASQKVMAIIRELTDANVDYVLIDAPPMLSVGDAGALAHCVDGLLLVVDVSAATRPVLEASREALDALPCRKLGVVVVGEHQGPSTYYR